MRSMNAVVTAFFDRNIKLLFGLAIGYLLGVVPERLAHYRQVIHEITPGEFAVYGLLFLIVLALMFRAFKDATGNATKE